VTVRLDKRQPKENPAFNLAREERAARPQLVSDAPALQTSQRFEEAHAVQIDPSHVEHPLAHEIANKRSHSLASHQLEVDESTVERVSNLLNRLRKLASDSERSDEFGSRDLLAAADEYQALQQDLRQLANDFAAGEGRSSPTILAANSQAEVNRIRRQLLENLSQAPVQWSPRDTQDSKAVTSPMLMELDATIGQIEEFQTYLQQLRATVDTQLMKPIGLNRESNEDHQRTEILERLIDSKRQIIESGCASLRSSKGLDPSVALRLLDPSSD
jgi:hypothetical protein